MTLASLFLIGNFGTTEILLILFVIILLFGAKRIPDLAKGLGKGIREFKDATKEEKPEYRDNQPDYRSQPEYRDRPVAPPVNPNDPNQPRY